MGKKVKEPFGMKATLIHFDEDGVETSKDQKCLCYFAYNDPSPDIYIDLPDTKTADGWEHHGVCLPIKELMAEIARGILQARKERG